MVYKCEICGFTYDDSTEDIKFENLSTSWTCPVCGVDKSSFSEIISQD